MELATAKDILEVKKIISNITDQYWSTKNPKASAVVIFAGLNIKARKKFRLYKFKFDLAFSL